MDLNNVERFRGDGNVDGSVFLFYVIGNKLCKCFCSRSNCIVGVAENNDLIAYSLDSLVAVFKSADRLRDLRMLGLAYKYLKR